MRTSDVHSSPYEDRSGTSGGRPPFPFFKLVAAAAVGASVGYTVWQGLRGTLRGVFLGVAALFAGSADARSALGTVKQFATDLYQTLRHGVPARGSTDEAAQAHRVGERCPPDPRLLSALRDLDPDYRFVNADGLLQFMTPEKGVVAASNMALAIETTTKHVDFVEQQLPKIDPEVQPLLKDWISDARTVLALAEFEFIDSLPPHKARHAAQLPPKDAEEVWERLITKWNVLKREDLPLARVFYGLDRWLNSGTQRSRDEGLPELLAASLKTLPRTPALFEKVICPALSSSNPTLRQRALDLLDEAEMRTFLVRTEGWNPYPPQPKVTDIIAAHPETSSCLGMPGNVRLQAVMNAPERDVLSGLGIWEDIDEIPSPNHSSFAEMLTASRQLRYNEEAVFDSSHRKLSECRPPPQQFRGSGVRKKEWLRPEAREDDGTKPAHLRQAWRAYERLIAQGDLDEAFGRLGLLTNYEQNPSALKNDRRTLTELVASLPPLPSGARASA